VLAQTNGSADPGGAIVVVGILIAQSVRLTREGV